jgi:Icc-related predicted phosphoesterase
MKIGCTADLHFGIDAWDDRQVVGFIDNTIAPAALDLLIVAGDVAEMAGLQGSAMGKNHEEILRRLRDAAQCPVAFCAGNHDIWTTDPQVDSLSIYRERLAEVAAKTETNYLDAENLTVGDTTIVGCYGHFDFSLRIPDLTLYGQPVLEEHYRSQTPPGYPEPVWMDGRHIKWDWDDPGACEAICGWGRERMESALSRASNVLFVSHGVPRNEINGHRRSTSPVSLFLNAFSGTRRLDEIIRAGIDRNARLLSVSGHTHKRVPQTRIDGVDYLNIGGTYGKPRLVVLEFPQGVSE